MTMFKPVRVSSSNLLDTVPIIEGQFIVDEESQTLYFDKSSSERIAVGSKNNGGGINIEGIYWNGEPSSNSTFWNDTADGSIDIRELVSDALLDEYYNKTTIDSMFDDIDSMLEEIETLMAEI